MHCFFQETFHASHCSLSSPCCNEYQLVLARGHHSTRSLSMALGIRPETQSLQDAKRWEVPPNANSLCQKKKTSSSNNFATTGFKRDYVFCALQQPSVSIKKKSRAWVNLTKMQLSTQTGCGSILPRQVREPGTELGRVEPQLRQKFGDKHDITPTGWKHFDRWALHQKIQFLSKSKHLKGMCYFLRHFSASARIFSTLFLIFAF